MKKIVVSGLNTVIQEQPDAMKADMGPGQRAKQIVMMKKNIGIPLVINGHIA